MSKLLTSPLSVFFAILFAILAAAYVPSINQYAEVPAKLYLSFLQMGIGPYVFTCVSLAIVNIFKKDKGKEVVSFFVILLVALLVCSIVCMIFFNLGNYGAVVSSKKEIRDILDASFSSVIQIKEKAPLSTELKLGFKSFLLTLVPSNIFDALAGGKTHQNILFAIFLGASIGLMGKKLSLKESYYINLEKINLVFKQIVDWTLAVLPIGIFFIVVNQMAHMSWTILTSLFSSVVLFLAIFIVLTFVGILLISIKAKTNVFYTVFCLRNPLLIVLTTSSSFACLSSLSDSMSKHLNFDKDDLDLLLPLGMGTIRFGSVIYFSCLVVFLSQMYSVPLSYADYAVILFGSIIAGLAAGATGIVNLQLLGITTIPLGIPLEVGLVLFAAMDLFIEPFRTLCNVFVNAAAVVFFSKKNRVEKMQAPF